MINRRHVLAFLAFAPLLGACATEHPLPGPVPKVGFAHLPPLSFNVANVEVTSAYASPMVAPNAEHRMPSPPERAMSDWAMTRLKAAGDAGSSGTATFTITDASVIETKLAKTGGVKGMFTYQPAERYDAKASANLKIDDVSGAGGSISVTAARSIEVSENATLAEREQAWVELVEKLMADFNTQMEQQITAHMTPWLMR